ncbi:3-oxoacyl-[acyl-carrier-protein] synthase III C-terminal domain-containing protein [Streptomyces sp. NPDC001118]
MAVKAAECALQRAGWRAEDVNLLIHSWLYYQGHELWSPPHYIAHRLGAVNCLPMAIHQGCDGGALALQDAVLRLSGQPGIGKALVTSADRFTAPAVDRWNCQPSMALGDGATAIALERGPVGNSPFSLLSLATASDVVMEVMLRGERPFNDYPLQAGMPADVLAPTREGTELLGKDWVNEQAQKQIGRVLAEALRDAGVAADDARLRYVPLPRVGRKILEYQYLPVLKRTLKAEQVTFDDLTGHLGCGDWGADLNDLYERQMLAPGEMAVLIGAGGGFTWMCAVVQANG